MAELQLSHCAHSRHALRSNPLIFDSRWPVDFDKYKVQFEVYGERQKKGTSYTKFEHSPNSKSY